MKGYKIWPATDNWPKEIAIKWNDIEGCLEYAKTNGINVVHINSEWGWKKGKALNFVLQNTWIKGISIVEDDLDISFLNELHSLEWLRLVGHNYKGRVDLLNFADLKGFFCYCHEKSYFNLNKCHNCIFISLNKYSGKNFLELNGLTKIEKMTLNYGKLESFKGIENFKNINDINVYSLPLLTDISALKRVANSIKGLKIQNCKKIEDYHSIEFLKNLDALLISECSPIHSVKFIKTMERIRYAYIGIEILDKDFSALQEKGFEFKKPRK